jgi:hypothetical protein
MNQIFLGMLLPFVVALLLYARKRFQASLRLLVWAPFCMGLGALWALVPDMPRLIGRSNLYHELARTPRSDVFLWHRSIDLVEGESIWYTVGVACMLGGLVFAAWRELRRAEEK